MPPRPPTPARFATLVALALSACSSASEMSGTEVGTIGGGFTGSVSGNSTTGGAVSGGTGGVTGSTGSAGSVGAANGSAGLPDAGGKPLATALSGSLAFAVSESGEFYGLLPDGGPDLSNLDCRLADGTLLKGACGAELPDGGAVLAADAGGEPDAGGEKGAPVAHLLDVYVTSVAGTQLSLGTANVAPPDDAGIFSTVYLTSYFQDGGREVLAATTAEVAYEVNATGMSGQFKATFQLADGGMGTLSGAFGANHCGSLTGY